MMVTAIKRFFWGPGLVPGNYGLPPQSYLLRNDNGNWVDVAPPSLGKCRYGNRCGLGRY